MGSVTEVFAQGKVKCPCNFHRMTGDIASKKMDDIVNRACTLDNSTGNRQLFTEYGVDVPVGISRISVFVQEGICLVKITEDSEILHEEQISGLSIAELDACELDLIAIADLVNKTGLSFPTPFACP